MKTIKFYLIFVIGLALFFTQSCEKNEEDQESATGPVAAFTANQTSITVGSSVDFTDQSKNSPTDWSWDFGDGGTSTQQNPSHTYNEAGTYIVSLTVTNNSGSDTETKTDYITVEQQLEVDCPSTVTDYDGNTYDVVKIGDQYWMAENLKVTHYAGGTPIQKVTGDTEWDNLTEPDKAWCYYNNSSSNGDTYGVLYTWAAAMNGAASSNSNPSGVQGVCPDGWHLPSDDEWEELAEYISNDNGGYTKNIQGWNNVGGHLKATSGWNSGGNGTDDYGFSGLPGGGRYCDGTFAHIGYYGNWWSVTDYSTYGAWYRYLYYSNESFGRYDYYKENGFSVRCLRD